MTISMDRASVQVFKQMLTAAPGGRGGAFMIVTPNAVP
jgi:hypothetical protein